MTYYPKNKIKTNLTATPLDRLALSNTPEILYTGFYYKLSDGRLYTGKYPGDGNNQLLIAYPENNDFTTSTPPYTSVENISSPPLLSFLPTPDDYKKGFFVRYFSKKRNDFMFQEFTKSEYDSNINNPKKLTYTFYKPFTLKWMLTGPRQEVYDFNQYSIKTTEEKEKVYGLNEFLKMNYIQYYKFTVAENLYTDGKEFMTPDGKIYVGPYHIHPDKGYMVGATHTESYHSLLIPIKSNMTGSMNIMNTQPTTNNINGGSY